MRFIFASKHVFSALGWGIKLMNPLLTGQTLIFLLRSMTLLKSLTTITWSSTILLPRRYIRGIYDENENKEYDSKYGVGLVTMTEQLKIGNSTLHIVDSDVVVQNKRYKGTEGLYELLFKKIVKVLMKKM